EKIIGSIYKGKVQNVLPGMGASFVDIGLGRNAFLYVDDINKTPLNIGDVEVTQGRSGFTINEKVSRGDDVLVQIVKEPRGLKGARVSTNISLPGRYLILMPTGKYSGVSRKIENPVERERLKKIVQRIRPEGMATVVRTAASGVSDAELIADLGVLLRMWHGIVEMYNRAPSPSLLHKDMNLVFKAARDFITSDVDRVLVDDAEESDKIRDFMRLLGPQYLDRIETYPGGRRLFSDFRVDEEVHQLMKPKVNLHSGGSIVIETTEAFTIVDVNSGKFTGGKNLEDTILKTNVEAAAEIARQVRLRDIGGIIVCDFIDMRRESSRNQVIETLEKGLRRDRTRSTIQSFSALGLLEFTRKRVGKDLWQQLRASCPTCNGLGSVLSPETVTIETFRKLRDAHEHAHDNGEIQVLSAPMVAAQMEFWYEEELKSLSAQLGTKIDVHVDPAINPERPKILTNGAAKPPKLSVRVGDEVEVDVISAKLPNPTSGLAVIDGRLVEIENGAGAVGQTLKVKILDIDGDEILAEPRTPVAAVGEGESKRRRRGGRGRGKKKPLTAAEQVEELRRLAEEAAKGVGARATSIGISTAAEAETEEVSARTGGAAASTAMMEHAADEANVVGIAESAPLAFKNEGGGRRRRRRRRRHAIEEFAAAPAAETAERAAEPSEPAERAEGYAVAAPGLETEEGQRRRRRRRRRRGRGGRGRGAEQYGEVSAVPDRHIFQVDGEGAAYATGRTAPREPIRAIAHLEPAQPPAIEPPPPSLVAPAQSVKAARPTRRRRSSTTAQAEGEVRALPAPEPAAEAAPKRRRSTAKAATETGEAEAPKPKRTRKAASSEKKPAARSRAKKKTD
ncbi:MAG: Rne/Rng family ribonuclease, partial [Candidatus Eremiobacteraeota bacterium]|nr:Rne/Rng family ribonuclease [Candidatus Eremiobacteraeota bacterium]